MSDERHRRKVRVGEIAQTWLSPLDEKDQELGIPLEALDILPDHVHLLIHSDKSEAAQSLADPFKRLKHPALRSRLASMWSRGYNVGNIDHISEETVKR
jgi:putative transposase